MVESPTVPRMAKDFSFILATSVPVERVFSKRGLVVRRHGCIRLNNDRVRALVSINQSMKSDMKKDICGVDI